MCIRDRTLSLFYYYNFTTSILGSLGWSPAPGGDSRLRYGAAPDKRPGARWSGIRTSVHGATNGSPGRPPAHGAAPPGGPEAARWSRCLTSVWRRSAHALSYAPGDVGAAIWEREHERASISVGRASDPTGSFARVRVAAVPERKGSPWTPVPRSVAPRAQARRRRRRRR